MTTSFPEECLTLLTRTPGTLNALLRDLPEVWISATEGPGTWSPYDVVGHLTHCERVDWMPRLMIILEHGAGRTFDPVDREAQFAKNAGRALPVVLDEFSALRHENLTKLRALRLQAGQLEREGRHPTLGPVTARQLLAAWTAHDLAHMLQVNRVMAKRFKQDVGPFANFLSVMK